MSFLSPSTSSPFGSSLTTREGGAAIETLGMIFGSQMISLLHEKFGNPNSKTMLDCGARMIQVPLWVGELLFELIDKQEFIETENTIESFPSGSINSDKKTDHFCNKEDEDMGMLMANVFVQAEIRENPRPKKIPRPPPCYEEFDMRLSMVKQLNELFPQYKEKTVKKLLHEKGYDFEQTIEELAAGSTVGEMIGSSDHTPRSPRIILSDSVHRSNSVSALSVMTDSSSFSNNSIGSSSSSSSTIPPGPLTALDYFEKAQYYRQLAAKLPSKKHVAYAQYHRLALECSQNARRLQEQEEDELAGRVTDVLDLHGFEVARAVKLLDKTIMVLKEKRSEQRVLEVITGRGNRNANNKAPLRDGIQLWLQQKRIRYQQKSYNQGSFTVHLYSA